MLPFVNDLQNAHFFLVLKCYDACPISKIKKTGHSTADTHFCFTESDGSSYYEDSLGESTSYTRQYDQSWYKYSHRSILTQQ